jgi:hypothetical protein
VGTVGPSEFVRVGVDAIYDDVQTPVGLARFASAAPARGAMFTGRQRAGHDDDAVTAAPVITEQAYYPPATSPPATPAAPGGH